MVQLDDQAPTIIAVSVLFMVVVSVLSSLRLWIRFRTRKHGLDDYTCIAALVSPPFPSILPRP
jgi:hypothetical protein